LIHTATYANRPELINVSGVNTRKHLI